MLNNYPFLYNNVPDEDLLDVINTSEVIKNEVNESFYPFSVGNDNYNNVLDVNHLYLRSRLIIFPNSEYSFFSRKILLYVTSYLLHYINIKY